MAKKRRKNPNSFRAQKRRAKRRSDAHMGIMDKRLNTLGNTAINKVLEKGEPITSDGSTKILEQYNKQWVQWITNYCKAHGLKLTRGLKESFETNMLQYIEKMVKPTEKQIENQNKSEENEEMETRTIREQDGNQTSESK